MLTLVAGVSATRQLKNYLVKGEPGAHQGFSSETRHFPAPPPNTTKGTFAIVFGTRLLVNVPLRESREACRL